VSNLRLNELCWFVMPAMTADVDGSDLRSDFVVFRGVVLRVLVTYYVVRGRYSGAELDVLKSRVFRKRADAAVAARTLRNLMVLYKIEESNE